MKECLPCSANCYTCVDNPTNCKSCVLKQILDSNFKCVAGFPCKGSNDTGCNSICHSSCNTCSGPKDGECLSCPSGTRLYGGVCTTQSCATNYVETSFQGLMECKKCHDACKTCSGTSHTQCIECTDGYLMRNGICTRCPPGQFLNRAQEIPVCSSCFHECSECLGPNQDDCTHCESPLNLMGSRCVSCCSNSTDVAGRECCHCINGQGPCVTLEHTRSVYGSGDFLESVSLSSRWSKNLTDMPSSVISFLAVSVIAVVIVFFVLLNLVMSNQSRSYLRSPTSSSFWRSQGSSSSYSQAHYRKLANGDQDLNEGGDDEYDDQLLFQKT